MSDKKETDVLSEILAELRRGRKLLEIVAEQREVAKHPPPQFSPLFIDTLLEIRELVRECAQRRSTADEGKIKKGE